MDFHLSFDDEKTRRYAETHQLTIYFEDAVEMLLKTKEFHPNLNVLKHFEKYFQQVSRGIHVLHRDFRFVCATSHNRKCFVNLVRKSFQGLFTEVEFLSLKEFHALLQLLCPDFPQEFLEKLSRVMEGTNHCRHDDMDSSASPKRFFDNFLVMFIFPEFTLTSKDVYDELRKSGGASSGGVNSAEFQRNLNKETKNAKFSIPPQWALRELLAKPSFTFDQFIESLSGDESLTTTQTPH